MKEDNNLYLTIRKKLDESGYRGVEILNIPYKTLCEAGELTEKQSSYKGIIQNDFPVYISINFKDLAKRITTKNLKRALLQGKRELKRNLALCLR